MNHRALCFLLVVCLLGSACRRTGSSSAPVKAPAGVAPTEQKPPPEVGSALVKPLPADEAASPRLSAAAPALNELPQAPAAGSPQVPAASWEENEEQVLTLALLRYLRGEDLKRLEALQAAPVAQRDHPGLRFWVKYTFLLNADSTARILDDARAEHCALETWQGFVDCAAVRPDADLCAEAEPGKRKDCLSALPLRRAQRALITLMARSAPIEVVADGVLAVLQAEQAQGTAYSRVAGDGLDGFDLLFRMQRAATPAPVESVHYNFWPGVSLPSRSPCRAVFAPDLSGKRAVEGLRGLSRQAVVDCFGPPSLVRGGLWTYSFREPDCYWERRVAIQMAQQHVRSASAERRVTGAHCF